MELLRTMICELRKAWRILWHVDEQNKDVYKIIIVFIVPLFFAILIWFLLYQYQRKF
jgi:hypothetical protein